MDTTRGGTAVAYDGSLSLLQWVGVVALLVLACIALSAAGRSLGEALIAGRYSYYRRDSDRTESQLWWTAAATFVVGLAAFIAFMMLAVRHMSSWKIAMLVAILATIGVMISAGVGIEKTDGGSDSKAWWMLAPVVVSAVAVAVWDILNRLASEIPTTVKGLVSLIFLGILLFIAWAFQSNSSRV